MIAADAQFPQSGAAAGLLLSRQGPLADFCALLLSRQPVLLYLRAMVPRSF